MLDNLILSWDYVLDKEIFTECVFKQKEKEIPSNPLSVESTDRVFSWCWALPFPTSSSSSSSKYECVFLCDLMSSSECLRLLLSRLGSSVLHSPARRCPLHACLCGELSCAELVCLCLHIWQCVSWCVSMLESHWSKLRVHFALSSISSTMSTTMKWAFSCTQEIKWQVNIYFYLYLVFILKIHIKIMSNIFKHKKHSVQLPFNYLKKL